MKLWLEDLKDYALGPRYRITFVIHPGTWRAHQVHIMARGDTRFQAAANAYRAAVARYGPNIVTHEIMGVYNTLFA